MMDLTQEQRTWLLQRSRSLHEVLALPFIDDGYRKYIEGLHTGLAVEALKATFGSEMRAIDMHFHLLSAAPLADDPTYAHRVMERFLNWARPEAEQDKPEK